MDVPSFPPFTERDPQVAKKESGLVPSSQKAAVAQSAKQVDVLRRHIQNHFESRREKFLQTIDACLQDLHAKLDGVQQKLRMAPVDRRQQYEAQAAQLAQRIAQTEKIRKDHLDGLFKERLKVLYNRYFDDYEVSRLEGTSWRAASHSYLESLQFFFEIANESEKPVIAKALDQLVFADQIGSALGDIESDVLEHPLKSAEEINTAINDIVLLVRSKITELSIGESIVLPGGNGSHAVLYEITKTSDSEFSFSVINTGDCAEGWDVIGGTSRVRSYTIDRIPLEDIGNPKFLYELFFVKCTQLQSGKRSPAARLLIWLGLDSGSMPQIYKKINSYLLGKLRVHPNAVGGHKRPKGGRLHYRSQVHGTCQCRCIETWVASSLGRNLYQKFSQFSLQMQSEQLEHFGSLQDPGQPVSFWRKIAQKLFAVGPLDVTSDEYRKVSRLAQKKLQEAAEFPIVAYDEQERGSLWNKFIFIWRHS
jgi:hypothetical protein